MPWADLTDARMYYELTGQGEAILMIPGLGCTCEVWNALADELSQEFLLVRVDNRGIGRSQARRPALTMSHFCADLAELLDYLQLDRVDVMGMSLGGIIAQRLAVEHPRRVERLVLISCTHQFSPYLSEMVRFMGRALSRLSRKGYARAMELLCTGPLHFDAYPEDFERRIAESCARRVPRSAVMGQLRALRASRFDPADYRIQCPTLVLAGEYDHLIPACYALRMADEIPTCEFTAIPDAGHSLVNERPREVVTRVISFLKAKPGLAGREPARRGVLSRGAGSPRTETSTAERTGASP